MLLMQKKKEKSLSFPKSKGARGHKVLFEQSPAAPVVLWLNQEDYKRLVGVETNSVSLHLGFKMGTGNLSGKTDVMP